LFLSSNYDFQFKVYTAEYYEHDNTDIMSLSLHKHGVCTLKSYECDNTDRMYDFTNTVSVLKYCECDNTDSMFV